VAELSESGGHHNASSPGQKYAGAGANTSNTPMPNGNGSHEKEQGIPPMMMTRAEQEEDEAGSDERVNDSSPGPKSTQRQKNGTNGRQSPSEDKVKHHAPMGQSQSEGKEDTG